MLRVNGMNVSVYSLQELQMSTDQDGEIFV